MNTRHRQTRSKLMACLRPSSINLRSLILGSLIGITYISWSHSIWIYAKAYAAQYFIEQAWQDTLAGADRVRPWPWADTWPIAKLNVETTDQVFYVLAGSHGTSLAFGPGHIDGTALPGQNGTSVFSGHRDTHFKFLKEQRIGDRLSVQTSSGRWLDYQIIERLVKNTNEGPWLIDKSLDELHLVTCYPFDARVPGGPLRHITIAQKVPGSYSKEQVDKNIKGFGLAIERAKSVSF